MELTLADEIAIGFSESASNEIARFALLYFGKEMKDLTKEDNQVIDSMGLYGCIDWLEDNDKERGE